MTDDRVSRFDPRYSWGAYLGIAGLAVTVIFAVLDPAPSQGLSLPMRILFWFVHTFLALLALQGAHVAASRLPPFDRLGPWPQIVLSGLAGALLFTPVAVGLDRIFPVGQVAKDQEEGAWAFLGEFVGLAPPMVIVWLALNGARFLRLNDPAEGVVPEPVPSEAAASGPNTTGPEAGAEFWSRVPKRLGRDLVSLSAELHYIRVVTTAGEDLVLFSFGRAVELLGTQPGMRIHRSHWIALDHVAAIERDGERVSCRLDTGDALPVSRPYRRALRDAVDGKRPIRG